MTLRNIIDPAIITAGLGVWLVDAIQPAAGLAALTLCCIRIWQELRRK